MVSTSPPARRVTLWPLAAAVAMYLVVVAGALVTNSGSADGCGNSWPLCQGRVLPPLDLEALIEFGHRAISGLAAILVVVAAAQVWRRFKHRPEIRLLVPASIFFLVLQAWLGAAAVMWPQPKAVLALHFGISLAAFASSVLIAVLPRQLEAGGTGREQPVSPALRLWVWGSAAFLYIVVYTGAYVRHTHAELACLGWPLCNGSLWPQLGPGVAAQLVHRLTAALAVVALARVVQLARREAATRPDVYRASAAALALLLLQVASGALVVLGRVALAWTMLHAALVTALFGVVGYLCLQVAAEPAAVPGVSPDGRPGAAAARVRAA